jgi:type I restriction enzyme, S subunit
MSVELLLREFERLGNTQDAVTRLRTFIVSLAVAGKLSRQQACEGPVHSALLGRSSVTKAPRMPPNWLQGPLGDLIELQYGKGLPSTQRADAGPVAVYGSNGVVAFTGEALTGAAAIIVGRKGSAGALVLANGPSWTTDVAYFVVPPPYFEIRFLFLALQALQLGTLGKGVKPGLSRSDAYQLQLVVPPMAEQLRIVGKVEELMILCDKLEAMQEERETQRDVLRSVSLNRLTSSGGGDGDGDGDGDEKIRDVRFLLERLPRLITNPEHLTELRQSILDLAVNGRLESGGQAGWRESALGDLLGEGSRNGYSRKPDGAADGIAILKISAGTMRKDGIVEESQHKLISGVATGDRERLALRSGDLLACRFNGNRHAVGVLSLFVDELGLAPIFPDKLIRLRADGSQVMPELLRWWSRSSLIQSRTDEYRATTVGNWGISASNLKLVVYDIPPLAEQHRIIARVDELMSLCDQLEIALTSAQSGRGRLLEALLRDALEGSVDRAEVGEFARVV